MADIGKPVKKYVTVPLDEPVTAPEPCLPLPSREPAERVPQQPLVPAE